MSRYPRFANRLHCVGCCSSRVDSLLRTRLEKDSVPCCSEHGECRGYGVAVVHLYNTPVCSYTDRQHSNTPTIPLMYYTCTLFNRNGKRIFYREYNRTYNAFQGNPEEETKLICGFLLSMNAIIEKISPDKWGSLEVVTI